jgi:hypothetical protein
MVRRSAVPSLFRLVSAEDGVYGGSGRLVAVRLDVRVGVEVVLALAWRRRAWTVLMSAPSAMSRLAKKCRKSR